MTQLMRAVIFASSPPPLGGVSSIVGMLKDSLAAVPCVGFSSPLPKKSGISVLIRPWVNLFLLSHACFRIQPGCRVLFFSSSGFSFYEKLLWSLLVKLCGRRPVVVLVDGNFPSFWSSLSSHIKLFARFLLYRSNVILGVQSRSWDCYYRSIFPCAECHVVDATVASDFFQAHPWSDSTQSSTPTILYVGWIIRSKGVEDLMRAFSHLSNDYPELRLRLIGPCFDNFQFWQNLSITLGIYDRVDFVGPVSDRQRLISEYRRATLFVLPSHAEGLPVVLLEAMALGVPCVSTDVGSVSDLLADSHAGILVPPHQILRLAKAIDYLLRDSLRRSSISRNAFLRARLNYGESQFISSYKKLLRI